MKRTLVVMMVLGGVAGVRRTEAQALAPTTPAPLARPNVGPYVNPYLIPALTAPQADRDVALLYWLTLPRAQGGLMPGTPAARPIAPARPAPAEMPRTMMVPGGGAARYFGRDGRTGAAANPARPYYQRYNRSFGSNGR